MLELLPIKLLHDEDSLTFGKLNVLLAKLARANLSVATGVVVAPQDFKLKTILEHFDFGSKEVFEQSLTLVKKELEGTSIPENLVQELAKNNNFLVDNELLKGEKQVWLHLLHDWINQIKKRLWEDGFSKGLTENLEPKKIIFVKNLTSFGNAEYEKEEDDAVLQTVSGKLEPKHANSLEQLIKEADKKLIVSYSYEWIVDSGKVFISNIKSQIHTTDNVLIDTEKKSIVSEKARIKSTVKVFMDLSLTKTNFQDLASYDPDGIFLSGERIITPQVAKDEYENLLLRIIYAADTFAEKPILFKLPDFSEGMGGVRGSMRLIHQPNILGGVLDALVYARFKHQKKLESGKIHGHNNIHVVIPFVRGVNEFIQIKRELAIKKLMRKNSLQIWLELAVPENFIDLDEYIMGGIDGVIINLDEMLSYLLGFDKSQEELYFYKKQVSSLIRFLDEGLSLLHKSKTPFFVSGSLVLDPDILEFLMQKGVKGVVIESFDIHSIHEILSKVEKRVILKRSASI